MSNFIFWNLGQHFFPFWMMLHFHFFEELFIAVFFPESLSFKFKSYFFEFY